MTATTEPPAPKVRVRERSRPAQAEAAPAPKRWQWDDAARQRHNEKRRQAYQNDPAVREKVKARARERKRRDDLEKDLEAHIGRSGDFGEVRHVISQGDMHCFTIEDLGEFIKYHGMVIRRWIDPENGQLPEPILEARPLMGDKVVAGSDTVPVYSPREAEAILGCMIEHQKSYRYFRTSHIETIDALARAIEKVRQG